MYQEEIRLFAKDSQKSLGEFRARKEAAHNKKYPLNFAMLSIFAATALTFLPASYA